MAPRSPFSTRQCLVSHGKGVTRLTPHCYYLSLTCLIPRFGSNRAYLGLFETQVGHPMSLNELEGRVQQIGNEMSQDVIQNLYASMLDRIASLHSR
ncbi:uncharacterized protein TNCV_70751 [Trichonephila clavipes]|nr:uncharacterized protein TNCV_70751 [Trichonephila clavipes]